MSNAFEEFRSVVLADPALQQALDALSDAGEFAAMASRLARQHGISLSEVDILRELDSARQNWVLRTLA